MVPGKVSYGARKVPHGASNVSTVYCLLSTVFGLLSLFSLLSVTGLGETTTTLMNKNEQILADLGKTGRTRQKTGKTDKNLTKTGQKWAKNMQKRGGKKRDNKTGAWQNMAKPKVLPNFGLGLPNPGLLSVA